mmetsp:Transcript_14845/g.22837  ORF Transcript_14845/g.22837 Transcript_14845/m.22837 type:complete len:472 (-) Transcript_14845:60-1475(-)
MQLFCLIILTTLLGLSYAKKEKDLNRLNYREFPRRTEEEAAVIEWGHSAVISALDVSVAHFGPQTSQAALLEVETQPILAEPLTGIDKESGEAVVKLDNAEEVHGNIVVMTNQGKLEGWTMAKIAMKSGAAALIVVNVDTKHPDDIYRLPVPEGESSDGVDIPVVMISYNSANVLTTATITPEMEAEEIVNHGMPERVRLYAGGDRPFFEDVAPKKPTLYLIHNLLTPEECSMLIADAEKKMQVASHDSILEMWHSTAKMHNMQTATLWQGLWQLSANKAIEERIEQVTGFPTVHYTDFVVNKYEKGSYWEPHYDVFSNAIAMATITIFLNDGDEPSIVYPNSKEPIKIRPKQGLAVVHHNTKEQRQDLDMDTLHAMMPTKEGTIYIAQKYILMEPLSYARRIFVPLFARIGLGSLLVQLHDMIVDKFGVEQGSSYFDKICVGAPVLLILLLVQFIADKVQGKKPPKKKKE